MLSVLKWLQWSETDLTSGLGGVEEHARCINRELRLLGIDAQISRDSRELENPAWDVIQTHGGGIAKIQTQAISIHTLHGTTLGRMAACGEWLWPGGYLAESREVRAVLRADVVLSVHPRLSLYRMAKTIGKITAVCGNGWNSGLESSESRTPLPKDILARIDSKRPLWLYVGRGDDRVKGADRVREVLRSIPNLQLLAVPGTGFEGELGVCKTGRLDSSQVRSLMELADGLLVPSRYEGNSLVVLEALAVGLTVISTKVGAAPVFPQEILGLEILDSSNTSEWTATIMRAEKSRPDSKTRKSRCETNRSLLPNWQDVARSALLAVERFRERKLHGG